MSKTLIDRNEALSQYFGLGTDRSLSKLREKIHNENPEGTPSIDALKDWSSKYSWQSQVMIMDKAVGDGLVDTLVPAWVELKAELIEIMVNQIRAGVEKGIAPENTRDMVALMKELRSLVGDDNIKRLDLKAELEPVQQIEFVMYDSENVRRDAATREPKPSDEPAGHQFMIPNNHRDTVEQEN